MPDKPEMVYVLYDFRISGLLPANLSLLKDNPPTGFTVEYPHPTTGMAQGEIWRNIVKPQLDMAWRVIAFVDLPNANVGFEVGYALGQRKPVALASYKSTYPAWLQQSPFKGFDCPPLTHVTPLENQILSSNWFQCPEYPQPEPGREILLLCPQPAGEVYIRHYPK
jgi:hypothetical protein